MPMKRGGRAQKADATERRREFLELAPYTTLAEFKKSMQMVFLDLVRGGENVPPVGRRLILQQSFAVDCIHINDQFGEVDTQVSHRVHARNTPLTWAILLNNSWLCECVDTLLELGADPNICDGDAFGSLLTLSATFQNDSTEMLQVAQLLIQHKADVSSKDLIGRTALHLAAFTGCSELAKLLIDNGACAEDKTIGGTTPLHAAAVHGQEGMVKLLIDAGVDVRVKDNGGCNAEYLAHREKYHKIEALLKDEDVRRYFTSQFFVYKPNTLHTLAAFEIARRG